MFMYTHLSPLCNKQRERSSLGGEYGGREGVTEAEWRGEETKMMGMKRDEKGTQGRVVALFHH